MNLILPSDNLIIDYSIINQIIAVLNSQQGTINDIAQKLGVAAGQSGGTTTITVGGTLKLTASSSVKTAQLALPVGGMTKVTAVSATAYTSSSTPSRCWISQQDDKTITFKADPAATVINYIIVGIA